VSLFAFVDRLRNNQRISISNRVEPGMGPA
jgi:hypothetical protein